MMVQVVGWFSFLSKMISAGAFLQILKTKQDRLKAEAALSFGK